MGAAQESKHVESGPVVLTPVEVVPDDDDGVITESTVRALSYQELRELLVDNQVPAPEDATNKEDLLTWMLAEFGVSA